MIVNLIDSDQRVESASLPILKISNEIKIWFICRIFRSHLQIPPEALKDRVLQSTLNQ